MKERKIHDYLVWFEIFFMLLSVTGTLRFSSEYSTDCLFLFNRVTQLRECFFDGNILGVFFYNDFNGVGYGSSFFYGFITLVPFIWLKDYETFGKLFFLVSIVVLYLGTRYLTKRLCKNYQFVTFMFMVSPFVVLAFMRTTLYLNFYAIGISFFFLGSCIDFFRDKKSFIKSSILFFLVMNTHMITTLLAFIGCLLLFIYYFDTKRVREYCKFLLYTVLVCSYYVVNFLWHCDGVLNTQSARAMFLQSYKEDLLNGKLTNIWGLDGFAGLGGLIGYFFNKPVGAFIVLSPIVLILAYKNFRKRKWGRFLVISFILSCILGVHFIWMNLYRIVDNVIQFPLRYLFFTLLAFLVICFRDAKFGVKFLTFYSTILMLFLSLINSNFNGYSTDLRAYQVGMGEYLSEDFVWDWNEFTKLSSTCDYEYEVNEKYIKVYVDENTSNWVRVPKLWYKGYKAVTSDGIELETRMGYSQFLEFSPRSYVGEVTVYYAHTWWLYILEIVCYISVLLGGIYGCCKDRCFFFRRKSISEGSFSDSQ